MSHQVASYSRREEVVYNVKPQRINTVSHTVSHSTSNRNRRFGGMGFTCNTFVFRTPTGLLKILEIVLVWICLLLTRFGDGGNIFFTGSQSDHFLAVGTFVGYGIIVPCILLTYVFGSALSILELFINLIGAILFVLVGVLTITYHQHSRGSDYSLGLVIGVISIAAGIVFLIDFILAIKNTRITIVQT